MSRHARHSGRPHHRPHRHVESGGPRPDRPVDRAHHPAPDAAPLAERPSTEPAIAFEAVPSSPPATLVAIPVDVGDGAIAADSPDSAASQVAQAAEPDDVIVHGPMTAAPVASAPIDGAPGPVMGDPGNGGCTPAQMRRFIKSRPWIPMHELRRRFGINGHEDDVTGVFVGTRTVYVGLPEREGRMLGELLRGGDVGYELSVDPVTPVVIGVFPMRPVART